MWGCKAETSHLVRRSRKRERPSVPESVLTFSSRKIGNPDKSAEPHTANPVLWTDLVFTYTRLRIYVRHLRVFQSIGRKKICHFPALDLYRYFICNTHSAKSFSYFEKL